MVSNQPGLPKLALATQSSLALEHVPFRKLEGVVDLFQGRLGSALSGEDALAVAPVSFFYHTGRYYLCHCSMCNELSLV